MPVNVVPYDAAWPGQFLEARAQLALVFGPDASIEHVGSTSIPGCSAQPIIDILVQLDALPLDWDQRDALEALNYGEVWGVAGGHQLFERAEPHTKVHVAVAGSDYANHRLWFRDYLREHPERRQAYETLKAELAVAHPNDRAAYTAAKLAFVEETIALATGQEADEPPEETIAPANDPDVDAAPE